MTIEYTAKVDSCTGVYFMRRNEPGEVFLINHIVRDADVPEVCEAMMTLAGHEWPGKPDQNFLDEVINDVVRTRAERIIARLKPLKEDKLPDELDGFAPHRWALIQAIEIVRKECGL